MKLQRTGARPLVHTDGHSRDDVALGDDTLLRGIRYSILPVITLDGIIAYDIIEGLVDGARFLHFLEEHVVRTICFHIDKNNQLL